MKQKAYQRQKRGDSCGLERVIFAAFFLSGLAGLMHEVVWAKLLIPLIGATAHAQAVVLGVFMGRLEVIVGIKMDYRKARDIDCVDVNLTRAREARGK